MSISLPEWMSTRSAGGRARVVDLSLPLTDRTPIYPGDPQPRIFTATTIAGEGYNLSHVHLGTQTGTHVDAPFHFRDDGATVDRLPLDLFAGPAVVVRVPRPTPERPIGPADVAATRGSWRSGVIVLFVTGWYRHAGTPRFFEHPYLTAEVGDALLKAGVRTIAIDTLNADRTGGTEFPIHDMFAQAGGLIAENLAGTAALTEGVTPFLQFFPLSLTGCDGSPVRAVALEPA